MIRIVTLTDTDRQWVRQFLRERWAGPEIVTRGVVHDASQLPGFVAWQGTERVGLVTYRIAAGECELVTLDALVQWRGIGTLLQAEVEKVAWTIGCHRIWLITTNDNMDALRFYQRRGYRLVAVYPDALVESRKLKSKIPEIGLYGIPLRDEIELEKRLG
ncbi:GNAT family N-acetyltransferase [Candidatus Bathyarchaeota archaeon]|nr:MAG: GNAT family N-acetyltransferase [Candidatus Bathyarchaeota archaeon]